MRAGYVPGRTPAPLTSVRMWLSAELSSSSKVTMSTLRWAEAHCRYASRCARAQASPVPTEQSCMSSQRFGTTKETVGRLSNEVGKLVYGWLAAAGTLSKSAQGLCLAAYPPWVQAREPGPGRSSEYPLQLRP